jgi:hypothetical protein
MKTFHIYEILPTMRNVLDKLCTENQNILHSITFFRKLYSLWDNVKQYGGARGARNDVTTWRIRVACWIIKATCTHAHAHTNAPGNTHARASTHKNNNTYCISTAAVVTQTHFNITLYAHCVSVALLFGAYLMWGIIHNFCDCLEPFCF